MIFPISCGRRFYGAFLIIGCLLFACGGRAAPAPKEKVVLKVFSLPGKQQADPHSIAAYRVMMRFQELHPEIEMVSSTQLKIGGDSMDSAPLMAIAGGTSPDIIYVNFRQSDTYFSQGFLAPLDEFVEKMTKEEFDDRVPEPVRPVIHREGPDGKMHYWAMPEQPMVIILKYRRDLFNEAGLDPDRPQRDRKEFKEYAIKLTDPKRGVYGTIFPCGENISWGMYAYLCSAGANAVKLMPDGQWRAAFDTPEAVTAYEFSDDLQKTMVTKDGKSLALAYRAPTNEDFYGKISDGKIAMMFDYLSGTEIGGFDPQLIGVGPVPKGPTGKSSSEINARMVGIFAGQKDPRVRAAAWEWIKFLDSNEARKLTTQTMVEHGAWRMLSPAWLRTYGYPELAKLVPPGLEELYSLALKQGTPEPYGKNCQFVYKYMTVPFEGIYFDKSIRPDTPMAEKRAKIQARLTAAVAMADEKMIGVLTPEHRATRNIVAWIVSIVGGFCFIWLITSVFRWMNASRPPPAEKSSAYKNRIAVMLILPALVLILMWAYYPLLRGSLMAFQNYSVMGGSPWVGMNNFGDVLFDPGFWKPMMYACYFCFLWMLLGFLPPLLLAVMLQEIPMGKILFRTLFYIPAVVSSIVVLFMWRGIYDPSPDGILNKILAVFHISQQSWIGDPNLAMICLVFPLAWASAGPSSILYLAALKGIPEELYEASDIDGASFFDKLRYIVFPYLRPLLVINLVGALVFGFKSGDAVLAMTQGGPNGATHVIGYEIFVNTFMLLRFGHGTAMAWILGIILLAFTAYQLKILSKVEFRTANR